MTKNKTAAASHMRIGAAPQAPGSKRGRPSEPGGRRLKCIAHPDTIENKMPAPNTSSNAWYLRREDVDDAGQRRHQCKRRCN
jgi:hypothetical protein